MELQRKHIGHFFSILSCENFHIQDMRQKILKVYWKLLMVKRKATLFKMVTDTNEISVITHEILEIVIGFMSMWKYGC